MVRFTSVGPLTLRPSSGLGYLGKLYVILKVGPRSEDESTELACILLFLSKAVVATINRSSIIESARKTCALNAFCSNVHTLHRCAT
jgi:hypothetical protein